MPDQEIDAARAYELHMDMCRTHALVGWVVMQNSVQYPNKYIARLVTDSQSPPVLVAAQLVTDSQSPYVLVAANQDDVRAMLPPGLVQIKQPLPQEVLELWVIKQGPRSSSTGSASTDTFQHAMSLLAAMSTATQLFVGLTGAAWAVLVPNAMALPEWVVSIALALHGLLGTVMFLVLRGLGANLVQRLNLSRWKERYGDKAGIGDAAWFGVPPHRYDIKKAGLLHPGSWVKWARVPTSLKNEIASWAGQSGVAEEGFLNRNGWTGGQFIFKHYAVPRYPTLRIQRTAWPLVPLFGALCSFYLSWDTWNNRTEHGEICSSRFRLLQQASTSLDLERSRYLLDKASCNVGTQPISESREHKAACDERFALLRQATTPLDLDRARYLLEKANCNIGSRPMSTCQNGQERCASLGG